MATNIPEKPNLLGQRVGEFASGVLGGSGKNTDAGTVGSIVAAAIPGFNTSQALSDIFDGVRTKNYAQAALGVISFLPGIGSAGTAISAAKAAGTKVAGEVVTKVGEK